MEVHPPIPPGLVPGTPRFDPGRVGLVAGGAELTHSQIAERSWVLAAGLREREVGRGSRVRIELPAGLEHVLLLHALARLRAVAVPVDPRRPARERSTPVDDAEATAIALLEPGEVRALATLGDPGRPDAASAGARPGAPDPEALQCVIHTSGTSGSARAVGLSWRNQIASAAGSAERLGVEAQDRWLCCLPPFHVAGLAIVLRAMLYGTAAVVHPGFDPERVADSLVRDRVTLVSLVGTQLVRLLEAGVDLGGPRAILLGGGPVPPDAVAEALERGARVVPTYGMTETASQVATMAPGEARLRPGSVGRPLPGVEVRISDGEILVRGPVVARACADPDGWLRTGDRGRLDEDGYLFVEGRTDEVIVTGGEKVRPEEVEEVLRSHPAVADAAVVGREHAEWGEAVTGIVTLREGAEVEEVELREHCAGRLAPPAVPKRIEVVEELPRTASGKLLRRELQ